MTRKTDIFDIVEIVFRVFMVMVALFMFWPLAVIFIALFVPSEVWEYLKERVRGPQRISEYMQERNFEHVVKVVQSCKTFKQTQNAYQWAMRVLEYPRHTEFIRDLVTGRSS